MGALLLALCSACSTTELLAHPLLVISALVQRKLISRSSVDAFGHDSICWDTRKRGWFLAGETDPGAEHAGWAPFSSSALYVLNAEAMERAKKAI